MSPSDPLDRTVADERAEFVFFQALRRPPIEREEYLSEACGEDTDLRGEVECFLRDHEKAGNFLCGDALATAELSSEYVRTTPEEAGSSIGPYKLLQQLGEGGCGVVWMAEQESPVRRRVALKVIKLGLDTKSVIARFEAERQALALMDHPNIAKVLDAGSTATGRPYFVMELVRGTKITQFCDQSNLPTDARLVLFTQVCQAIQHAHQKGIIHRDIKPSNILVTLHDGVPVPRVIDFGIAKATTGQRLTDRTVFTAFEQFLGTPAYMSPEQAEMSGLDVDTRSDIYSLGVLLYELLTGQTPFNAKDLIASGLDAMRRTIREQEPPRPSTRLSTMLAADATSLAQRQQTQSATLSHSLRGDLDWIVMKALEKDRSRRYESASSMAGDIQRHLDGKPVIARPPTPVYRLQKFVRRHRLAVAATSAVLASIFIGLAVSTWMFFRQRESLARESMARERAVAAEHEQSRLLGLALAAEKAESTERRKAESEAVKSRQVAKFLTDMLEGVGPEVAMGRDTTILREILNKTADRVTKDLADQPALRAELQQHLSTVYIGLGDYAKAEVMETEALATFRKLYGGDNVWIADSLNNLGWALVQQGRMAEAEPLVREGLAMYQRMFGEKHAQVPESMLKLAYVLEKRGQLAEAEELVTEVMALQKRVFSDDQPALARALSFIAGIKYSQKKLEEAEAYAREAVAIDVNHYGRDHYSVAKTLNNLGTILIAQKKLAEAEEVYLESMVALRRVLGNKHPDVGIGLQNLALVLRNQGKLTEAAAALEEALEIRKTIHGENHPFVLDLMFRQGELLFEQNKYAESEFLHRHVLEMRRQHCGQEHEDVAISLNRLGYELHTQGRLSEAEAMHRESLVINRKALGSEHSSTVNSLANIAVVLQAQGRVEEAESMRNEAIAILRRTEPPDRPTLESLLSDQAERFYRTQRFADAERLYREVMASRRARGAAPGVEGGVTPPIASLGRLLTEWVWSERDDSAGNRMATPENRARLLEAERLLREALEMWVDGPTPEHWRTGEMRSRLGGALVVRSAVDPSLSKEARHMMLTEAESLLMEGNKDLLSNDKVKLKYQRDALDRLVRLYSVWGKPQRATAWRRKLDALKKKDER